MDVKKKNIGLLIFVVTLVLCLCVGIIYAGEFVRAADEPALELVNGASVRIADISSGEAKGNGLRFVIAMDKMSYNELVSDPTYTDILFGVLIAPDTATYELTKENVFGSEKKYDWATWNETTKQWEYTESQYTRIMNFESRLLYIARATEDASKVYYRAAITDLKESNLAKNFQAVGYIRYTKDGVTNYVLTEKVSRSMALVAQKAIADESKQALTAEEKAWLQTNYVDKVKQVAATYKKEYYKKNNNGEYELYQSDTIPSTIDAEVTLEDISLPGYICDNSMPNLVAGKVWADSSLVLKKYYKPEKEEQDDLSMVDYIWGGSAATATISLNTDAEGLCGETSFRSIKIEDLDITGYNDYAVKIPTDCTAFSANIKVIVNTTSTITKDLPLTNGTGNYLGAVKLNEWQKVYASGGDWIVTFGFPELIGGDVNPAGTATIYLDNIEFFTEEMVKDGTWNPTCWVNNSVGTGDGDAIADIETKFDITLGTAGSLYKNYKNRYLIQTVAYSSNGSHTIKVKAPNVKDISNAKGISFAIDMQMNGSGAGEIPLYLIKKGTTYTSAELGALSDFSNQELFTKIHGYKVDMCGATFNGTEVVTITAEQLKAAGYDLTQLDDLTFVFRDVEINAGWWNVLNMYFYDFKLY